MFSCMCTLCIQQTILCLKYMHSSVFIHNIGYNTGWPNLNQYLSANCKGFLILDF